MTKTTKRASTRAGLIVVMLLAMAVVIVTASTLGTPGRADGPTQPTISRQADGKFRALFAGQARIMAMLSDMLRHTVSGRGLIP